MGKRKRRGSAENSRERDKTSAELCEEYRVNDVDLEYTEADYQNLTTFSFFVRMVRPQISAANPRVAASKMTAILEAKWKEFRESKKIFDQKRKLDLQRTSVAAEKAKPEKEVVGKAQIEAVKAPSMVKGVTRDDDDESNLDAEEETEEDSTKAESEDEVGEQDSTKETDNDGESSKTEDESVQSEESEEEVQPKRRKNARLATAMKPLRIKIPIPMRKSTRDRRSKRKGLSDRDFEKLLGSDEDEGAWASEESQGRTSRRRRSRRKADLEFEMDSEEESQKSRKRKNIQSKRSQPAKRRKAPSVTEDESTADSQGTTATSSDESDDSHDKSRKKKKSTKRKEEEGRIHIPGERRSERAKRSLNTNADGLQMTDREFEKMMKREEKEKEQRVKEKRKKQRAKKRLREIEEMTRKKMDMVGKKSNCRDEDANGERKEQEDGNESDHCWYCCICNDGGDLILCDTCPMAFHQDCLKMDEVPEGKWSCPKCTGDGLEQFMSSDGEEEEEGHEQFCKVCHDGGDILLCDFCPCVFHKECLNPPLKVVPEGEWKCPRCVIQEKPLKGDVSRILTWRWSHQLKGTDELDHTHTPRKKSTEQREAEKQGARTEKQPERQLFVKYKYHSYWDCEWIPELALEVFHHSLHYNFRKKWDLDEPPALEDGSSFGKVWRKSEKGEDDPHNLEDKYYRYGIKPEWLIIHRIIAHDENGNYLVKWTDLPYEEATWEHPDEVPPGLDSWQKHVDAYLAHRKEKRKDPRETSRRKKNLKKSTLKKKLEKQPDCLGANGGKLHPYQLEGLNWLRFSWAQDTNTILADEMGLGKTIQAIAILYTLWKEGFAPGPFLISAPLSTVPNWEREFQFWAPDMYVVTYTGSKENRGVIRERDFSYKKDPFPFYNKAARLREGCPPKFDVILTNYEMCSVDQTTLQSIHWSMLIIDEAHRLKSQQSLFFKVMSQYKIDYKLLLTGTPLQNNLEELFNLLSFLEPHKFDDIESFLEQFSEISKEQQVTKLHEMLAPHMLRRMKSDVLKDLPSKSEFIVRVELSALQKKFYKHILTKNFEALNVKGMSNQTSLMNIMMDLRKCCNHPFLFPSAAAEAPLLPNGAYEGGALMKASGKLELLASMLDKLERDNHRVLIFSQMTRVLDLLEDFLEFKKFAYERIDGSIMGSVRQAAIDRFNSPNSKQFVFLLSTKAGGLGINLASADTVIIFDMDWNPHNDIQAFSRAHRIGQTNKVMIYRFVCRSSVEEKMAEVCKRKMMLTELVIHRGGLGSKEKKESLSKKEVSDILKYGAEKLFKGDEKDEVVYDDAAIEKLLDRSNEGDESPQDEGEEGGMNEYLRSFRVASYKVKEGQEEEEEEERVKEQEEPQESDQQYWQRVLGSEFDSYMVEKHREEELRIASMGKGKRARKRINYAETRAIEEMMQARRQQQGQKQRKDEERASDYEPTSPSSSEGEETEEDAQGRGKSKKGKKAPKEPFPPLLAKINGHLEVLSFTPRQRRVFLDTVMKFGMPPDDPYKSQWLVRELRCKSEKVFKAYCTMFLRHLCEALPDSAEVFSDGVPREGLSRRHVLTRIGIIALIRRKVQQFEENNGVISMAEFPNALPPPGLLTSMLHGKTPDVLRQHPRQHQKQQQQHYQQQKLQAQKEIPKAPGLQTEKVSSLTSGRKTDASKSCGTEKGGDIKGDADADSHDTKDDTERRDVKDDDDKSVSSESFLLDDKTGDVIMKDKKDKPTDVEGSHVKANDGCDDADIPDKDTAGSGKNQDNSDVKDKVTSRETPAKDVIGGEESSDTNSTANERAKSVSPDKQSVEDHVASDKDGKVSHVTADGGHKVDALADEDSATKAIDPAAENGSISEEVTADDEEDDAKESNKFMQVDGANDDDDEVKRDHPPKSQSSSATLAAADTVEEDMDVDKEALSKEGAEPKIEEGKSPSVKEGQSATVDSEAEMPDDIKVDAKEEDAIVGDLKAEVTDELKEQEVAHDERNNDSAAKSAEPVPQEHKMDQCEEDSTSLANREDKTGADRTGSDKTTKDDGTQDTETAEDTKAGEGKETTEPSTGDQQSTETKKEEQKQVDASPDKDSRSLKETSKCKQQQEEAKTVKEPGLEKAQDLRPIFWIADGGFTELHALWAYEEKHLASGQEYQTWHRRHDYWLLAGIVTHGYRHWQDILRDQRFDILNRAFRTEGEVMRKAAFLNRRFQLLEQALVIEEQLRKATAENEVQVSPSKSGQDDLKGPISDMESLEKVDELAEDLRRLNKGEKPVLHKPTEKLQKAWNSISLLVQDVRQGTFTNMPATMARPPAQPPTVPPPAAQKQTPGRTPPKVICID